MSKPRALPLHQSDDFHSHTPTPPLPLPPLSYDPWAASMIDSTEEAIMDCPAHTCDDNQLELRTPMPQQAHVPLLSRSCEVRGQPTVTSAREPRDLNLAHTSILIANDLAVPKLKDSLGDQPSSCANASDAHVRDELSNLDLLANICDDAQQRTSGSIAPSPRTREPLSNLALLANVCDEAESAKPSKVNLHTEDTAPESGKRKKHKDVLEQTSKPNAPEKTFKNTKVGQAKQKEQEQEQKQKKIKKRASRPSSYIAKPKHHNQVTSKKSKRRNWSVEEALHLNDAVDYCTAKMDANEITEDEFWGCVVVYLNDKEVNRSVKQVRERWLTVQDPKINKEKWTFPEDEAIRRLFPRYKDSWCMYKKDKRLENRTPLSVRNRYILHIARNNVN